MSIWERLKQELIDIVQWLDDTNNTMVYRFDRFNNEIKYGAKLVVREGQAACFVNEGELADVFTPGTHTLTTKNLPILGTLKGWKYGFESPFKAEVYFCSTRQFTDLKWGTANPIMVRDPEFGPMRLRAFGAYTVQIKDPGVFLKQVVGTDSRFTTEEITGQLRNLIVAQIGTILGSSGIAALDLAGNYDRLGGLIRDKMAAEFAKIGLDLPTFTVENISLPEEVEKALDKRTSMGVIGDVNRYTQFQAADALKAAAENTGGGGAAAGMGLGAGMALGQQMGQAMSNAQQAPRSGPPPMPGASPTAFFIGKGGQQTGPFDLAALSAQARAGQLARETLVWAEGMPAWAAASTVPALSPLFPPPMPQ
ncbi:MAG: SPFH domain-containing protein [Phycisphaerales bacterium]